MMRLVSLVDADPKVKDETLFDTVCDIFNYASYYLLFKEEEKLTDFFDKSTDDTNLSTF